MGASTASGRVASSSKWRSTMINPRSPPSVLHAPGRLGPPPGRGRWFCRRLAAHCSEYVAIAGRPEILPVDRRDYHDSGVTTRGAPPPQLRITWRPANAHARASPSRKEASSEPDLLHGQHGSSPGYVAIQGSANRIGRRRRCHSDLSSTSDQLGAWLYVGGHGCRAVRL